MRPVNYNEFALLIQGQDDEVPFVHSWHYRAKDAQDAAMVITENCGEDEPVPRLWVVKLISSND